MDLKIFFVAALVFGAMVSCQKGVDWTVEPTTDTTNPTTPPTNTTGELLVKTVSVTGNETTTINYTYNAQKQLETEQTVGTMASMPYEVFKRYYRDAQGRIVKTAEVMKQMGVVGDTSFTHVYYPNATTSNFSHTVREVSMMGMSTLDSSVYVFDAGGNLTTQTTYTSNILQPTLALSQKWEYNFANGNLTEMRFYMVQPGTQNFTLTTLHSYNYDDKTNPLVMNAEAFLTGRTDGASKNNVVKLSLDDRTTSNRDATIDISLNYGAGNKPTTATATVTPGNQVTRFTFYYQ